MSDHDTEARPPPEPVNYLPLSGAEFVKAVGADPRKWADSAMQVAGHHGYTLSREWLEALLEDAMAAAAEQARQQGRVL